MLRINEIDEKIIKFKESIKKRMNEKIEKSIKALESSVSKLIMNMESKRSSSNMRSSGRIHNEDEALYHRKLTSPHENLTLNNLDIDNENPYANIQTKHENQSIDSSQSNQEQDTVNQLESSKSNQYVKAFYNSENFMPFNQINKDEMIAEISKGCQELDSQLREYINQEISDMKEMINFEKHHNITENKNILE